MSYPKAVKIKRSEVGKWSCEAVGLDKPEEHVACRTAGHHSPEKAYQDYVNMSDPQRVKGMIDAHIKAWTDQPAQSQAEQQLRDRIVANLKSRPTPDWFPSFEEASKGGSQ